MEEGGNLGPVARPQRARGLFVRHFDQFGNRVLRNVGRWPAPISHDGERDGDCVRLITKGGYNWSDRYPRIVEAARKARQRRFVLDGEAVILGVDEIADLNALHSRKHNDGVQFCAFDVLVDGDDDLCKLPLSMRKSNLERLLARIAEGLFVSPFERGELGLICLGGRRMGLQGLVSKRPDRGGPSKDWVKIKNRTHPAMERVMESFR